MKLGVIGYGAMGQMVQARAKQDGHQVAVTISSRDAERDPDDTAGLLRGLDVVIDFSVGSAVAKNAAACARAGVPLVEGTTGWSDQKEEVLRTIRESKGTLVYGANFSIGVNIFYRIVAQAAALYKSVEGYEPFIEEAHHSRKRDAPSGTALRLREIMNEELQSDIPIVSTRAGYIPGTHRVGFDSAADQILLTHSARSREGFAAGALLAARWSVGRSGVFEFADVIDEIVNK